MIPHGVGKCHEVTKGTGSRQELATNEVSRLRDCLGSLVKGDSHGVGKCQKAPLKRVIPHGVGKCHVVTKGTGSRQELATNEVSRLRD